MVIKETNSGKRWTVEEAERQIMATLILGARRDTKWNLEVPRIRSGDLQKSLVKQGHVIGIKTFSTAIHNLTDRKELEYLKRGREKWYAPTDPTREQQREVYAAAEIAKIRMGAPFGVLQDSLNGWTYFGVPPKLGRRIQKPMREAAEAFQGEIDAILEAEVAGLIKFIGSHTRGKLPKKDYERGAKTISEFVSAAASLNLLTRAQVGIGAYIEKVAPTALGPMTDRLLGEVNSAPEPTVRFLVRLSGMPEEKVRAEMARERKNLEALSRLMEALPAGPRQKAWENLQVLIACRAHLCAVIR